MVTKYSISVIIYIYIYIYIYPQEIVGLLGVNEMTSQTEIWNEILSNWACITNYISLCINGCGLVIATPI